MVLKSVFDEDFNKYGKVCEGFDWSDVIEVLDKGTQLPTDGVEYIPSFHELETVSVFDKLRDSAFGGMPIQIGYCNGFNTKLNCLEYHRDSEIDITHSDMILLLASQADIEDWKLSTNKVEAFLLPAGTAVELYATTLHYAPCDAGKGENAGFKVAVVLPKDTNTDRPQFEQVNEEDKLLFARNKWLVAHPEADEVSQGAFVGLTGENLDVSSLIE